MKMKDFPSCFGESGIQVADSSPSTANRPASQNLVTCVYHHHSQALSGFITVTWIKNLIQQGLSIGIQNSLKEPLDVKKLTIMASTTVDIYWDLSPAKFGAGPEPLEGFYLAIAINQELCLILGDLQREAYKKVDPAPFASRATFIARKEHIFGKRQYSCKAQFCSKGRLHDIRIEYDPNERLKIFVDNVGVLEVTHLVWKFRGNQTILVDGVSVEVYWDVHSWLFGGVVGNAIFLFHSHSNGEKPWIDRWAPSEASAKGWQRCKDSPSQSHGFSLVLCAWKNE